VPHRDASTSIRQISLAARSQISAPAHIVRIIPQSSHPKLTKKTTHYPFKKAGHNYAKRPLEITLNATGQNILAQWLSLSEPA
jgi:hypothetical protein